MTESLSPSDRRELSPKAARASALAIIRSAVVANGSGEVDLSHFGNLEELPLKGINLDNIISLDISYTAISDANFLESCRNIKSLDISNTKIEDISFVKNLGKLRYLRLSNSPISDISPLQTAIQLEHLSLFGLNISDISGIKLLKNLVFLSISYTKVSDIGPISDFKKLDMLMMSNCPLLEIPKEFDASNISRISLFGSSLRDIAFLRNSLKIRDLDIGNMDLEDLSPIANLEQLIHGAIQDPNRSGLSFSGLTDPDNIREKFGELDQPERTIQALNAIRHKAGLVPFDAGLSSIDEPGWKKSLSAQVQSRLGARFLISHDRFALDSSGAESDQAAAQTLLVRQLHGEVRRKATHISGMISRVDNQSGWEGIGSTFSRFERLVSVSTEEINENLGSIYSSLLELGSFLELDDRASTDENCNVIALEPEISRPFRDFIATAGPWLRRFPTIRELDDEAGAYLSRRNLYAPSSIALQRAFDSKLLSQDEADLLRDLLDAAERGLFQGDKAGARGISSARNLVTLAAAVVSSFAVGSVSSQFAVHSILANRAADFLVASEAEIIEVFSEAPSDLRSAMKLMISDVKNGSIPTLPRELTSDQDEIRRRRRPR